MKVVVFELWLSLALLSASKAEEVTSLVLRILEPSARKTDLSLVTPENHDAVVKLLRDIATLKVRKIGTTLPDESGAEIVLLRLADHETISRVVTNYQRSYGSRDSFNTAENFEWAAQGAIIPYLAEDFFREDGDKSTIVRMAGGLACAATLSSLRGHEPAHGAGKRTVQC